MATVSITAEYAKTLYVNSLQITDFEGNWTGKYYTDYPITIRCDAKDGYRFAGWVVDGKRTSTNEILDLTLDSEGNRVEAIFEPIGGFSN